MLEKDVLASIFRLVFIEGLSLRKVSADLGIHRSTVSRYADMMEQNLYALKDELVTKGKCTEEDFDSFVIDNLDSYLDKVISFSHTRSKRVLTDDIIQAIHDISKHLNTSSAIVIFNYIDKHLRGSPLYDLSYSSIWRGLLQLKNNGSVKE